MLFAKYLIRLDDACPTMDHSKWDALEQIFDRYGIRPIVAVIPNNEDSKQVKSELDPFFWTRVRRWRGKGWEIALHGYNHVYTSVDPGLIPLNHKSEFAGLSLDEQREKIRKGVAIFRKEGLDPRVWVAPSHTFDENTLIALKEESNISIISDGIAFKPYSDKGFLWLPVQIWRLRRKYYGIWTVCLHPNEMKDSSINSFAGLCSRFSRDFISVDSAIGEISRYSLFDRLYRVYFDFKRLAIRVTLYISRIRKG